MSLILNIDTAVETAMLSLARDGEIIASRKNSIQKDHAVFLHPAINDILKEASVNNSQIDAIAVTNGPGSYTGLRVGLAAAKGLCYALVKPLVTICTLDAMAVAAIKATEKNIEKAALICPMIDARRMEVYTAVYDREMKEILAPCAMILSPTSFKEMMERSGTCFLGSGAKKWDSLINNENAYFINEMETADAMARLSYSKFLKQDFTELALSEPRYLKEFFSI